LRSLECRGSCIFRRLALEPRCFREPFPSLRMLEARAFDLRSHLAAVAKIRSRVVHTFRWPSPFASFDTFDVLDPRAREFVLTLSRAHVRATCTAVSPEACASRLHPPRTCLVTPCGAPEHTHCARSSSAYCHRESLASRLRCRRSAATLLELLSLPTRPPSTRLLRLSPQPPRARKISPTRLAALLTP